MPDDLNNDVNEKNNRERPNRKDHCHTNDITWLRRASRCEIWKHTKGYFTKATTQPHPPTPAQPKVVFDRCMPRRPGALLPLPRRRRPRDSCSCTASASLEWRHASSPSYDHKHAHESLYPFGTTEKLVPVTTSLLQCSRVALLIILPNNTRLTQLGARPLRAATTGDVPSFLRRRPPPFSSDASCNATQRSADWIPVKNSCQVRRESYKEFRFSFGLDWRITSQDGRLPEIDLELQHKTALFLK